jgi:site-specific recombinase XerD
MALVPSSNKQLARDNTVVFAPLIELVTNTVASPNSKRAYRTALAEFLTWLGQEGFTTLNAAAVNGYIQYLRESDRSKSSINQQLAAIRNLANQAMLNGLISQLEAWGISQVKNEKIRGRRTGNWLNRAEAQQLIWEPLRQAEEEEIGWLKAYRDQAIISIMIGAGLRRSEAAGLTFGHIQQREGRWAIIDLEGKGGRLRSFPIPAWVKHALDRWTEQARLGREPADGCIFRALNKGIHGRLSGEVKTKYLQDSPLPHYTTGNMTAQAIFKTVRYYAQHCGFPDVAAHDLRRTAANLALKGGADIREIQYMLGHASILTTEKYLEPMMSLSKGAADFIDIRLEL